MYRPLIRCFAAGIFLLALALTSAAQDPPRHKIGWLKVQSRTHAPEELKSFVEGLRARGHIEGTTFNIEERYADGDLHQQGDRRRLRHGGRLRPLVDARQSPRRRRPARVRSSLRKEAGAPEL